ncbi:MAG: tetratricopeptide repeat protein [Candidatus Brocadiales bacterium]
MSNKINHKQPFFIGVIFLLAFLVLKPTILLGDDVEDLLDKAKKHYAERAAKGELENAIKYYEEALKKVNDEKTKPSICVELAKCYFKLGYHHEKKKKKKSDAFSKGEKYAKDAIEKDSENVGGYYWKAANLGSWGNIHRGKFIFYMRTFKKALKEVIDRNPSYEHYGAHVIMAAYYKPRDDVPINPLVDIKEAQKHIDIATAGEGSKYLLNLKIKAEIYEEIDKEESKRILQSIINQNINQLPDDARFENELVQKEVKEMLEGKR